MALNEPADDDRPMADTQLKITAHESISVRRADEARLEVEVTYAPGGSPPPAHFHPTQEERFEVLTGELRARVEGTEHVLGPGDTLSIPRGAVHTMWNPGDRPVRAIWETTPRGRTLEWFRAIDALHREGRVDKNGMPGPLAFGVLLTEYDDVFRLAARPRRLIRLGLRTMGAVGRLRGYSATPPPLRSAA